ncbi:Origin recognition complex subunit 3, partial [Rhodosporidiobolus nylandii]
MDGDLAPFSEPIASTSRAVYTLAYKEDDEGQQPAEDFTDAANLELYEQAWNACNAQIQTTLSSLHDASLDQIVSFVHASADTAGSLYSALSGRVPLPTGLIVGAYPGSSSLLYSSLIRLLTRPSSSSNPAAQAPCIVSRVSSRDCSNIKNALRSVIGGFVGSAANVEIEDDDEEEEMEVASGPATLKSALIVPEDMLNLKAWYEHRYGKKDSESAPNLAVLLEDLEAMDGKVLTQLLETLSLYTSTLPLVLLVGVATTADALYNLVPRRTCNKLDAQSFFVDPGVGAFNALVRGVFVDSLPPLQLGPKAYNDMWRTFEDLHHSIDATISFIQYLYMNHFTSSPLSPLTLPPSPSFSPSAIAETLRSLPSVTSSTSPLAAPLVDPSATSSSILDSVSAARTSLAAWHASRSVAFEALLACMEFWERRKPMEVCLGMVLGEHSAQMAKTVDDLAGLVLQASSAKLPNFLRHLTSRLSSFAPASPLLAFLEAQLSALQPILDAPRPAGRANLVNSNLAGSLLALPAGFPAAAGQAGLTQADKDFSRLAKETAEGLKARLKDALKPCTELFLHEIWFSNDSSAMK